MVKGLGVIWAGLLGMAISVTPVVRAEPLDFSGSGNLDFSLTGGGIESTSNMAIFNQTAYVSSATNAPTMTQNMDTSYTLKTSEPIKFTFEGSNGLAGMTLAGFGQKTSQMSHEFKLNDDTGNPYYFGIQQQSTSNIVQLDVKVKIEKPADSESE